MSCSSTGLGPAVGDQDNMNHSIRYMAAVLTTRTYASNLNYVDIQMPRRFSSVVEQLAAVQQVIGSNPVADSTF